MTKIQKTMANLLCCRDVGIYCNVQVCAAMEMDTGDLTFWRDSPCVDPIAYGGIGS